MSVFIDIAVVALSFTAPAGTVLNGNVYSDSANWAIDPNPSWNGLTPSGQNQSSLPDTYAKYIVTNLDTSQTFKRDTRFNIPYTDTSTLADPVRRMFNGVTATPGIIELAENLIIGGFRIGIGDTGNHTDMAYWGPISGPFLPVQGITVRSRDPYQRATIKSFSFSQFTKNNASQTFNVGPCEVLFDHLDIAHVPGSKYIVEGAVSVPSPNTHRRMSFWNVVFKGDKDWGGGYDCLSTLRAGYGQWDFQDCEWRTENLEHCVYVDAPQGLFRMLRCFNTATNGLSEARCGNTFFQIVQRTRIDDPPDPDVNPYYGGPPGYGTVLVEDVVATRTGVANFASSFTVAGFLGDVVFRRCQSVECQGGMIAIWTPTAGGFHAWMAGASKYGTGTKYLTAPGLTTGFDDLPAPLSRTAYSTRRFVLEDFFGAVGSPYLHNTSAVAISGCQEVEINGFFEIATPNAAFAFWGWGNPNDPDGVGGRLDNGTVTFNVATPLASYFGFASANTKVRYGYQNNPLQTGLGSAKLSDAQINALDGANSAYPPWRQPLDGSLFLDSTTFDDLVVPDHQVDLIASSGTHVFIDPATFTFTHPDATVDAPFNADLSVTTLAFTTPDHTVDVQTSPIDVFVDPTSITFEAPALTLDVPVLIDIPVVPLTFEAPDAVLDFHSARITNVLFKAFGVTVTTPDHTVDAPRTIDIEPIRMAIDTPAMLVTSPVEIDIAFTQLNLTAPEQFVTFGQSINTESVTFDFAQPDATVDMHEPFLTFTSPPMVWRLPYRRADGAKRYLSLNEELEAVAYDQAGVARTRGGPLYVTALRQNGERVALNYEAVGWSMQITSLARVKAHIGGITTSQNDALLTSLIDSISARVEQYLWRTVAKQSYTEQHELRRGDKVLTLRASPIVSVQSLKVVSHPDNFTEASAYSSTSWSLDSNLALIRLLFETPAKVAYVQVVYLAGMATDTTDFVARYPDIAQQCDAQVAYEFSRRNTPGGNTTYGAGGTAFTGDVAFLPEFKRTLDAHRRVVH